LTLTLKKMTSRLLSIIIIVFLSNLTVLFGKGITPEMAGLVAKNCIFEKIANQQNISYDQLQIKQIKIVKVESEPVYYIVNLNLNSFVIISANDVVYPVLAYSSEGIFTENNQPENFSSWMDGIGKQILFAKESNQQADSKTADAWQHFLSKNTGSLKLNNSERSISPLLFSTWDQGYPYNIQCPEDANGSGGHVWAGCVATAMAQVMYYWRFPLQGSGSHGYYSSYGYLTADFGNTFYHWDLMSNTAGSQNDEIAQLLSHLGISVDMMYSGSGSGAYSWDAAEALRTYFNYNTDLTLLNKDDYSDTEWANILMANLDSGHPLYYHGFGSGGHAFNVDGYQGSDYFHFNWGWSGSYNGYYYLNNLNPGGSNFSEGQGAIVNIEPAGNYPYYCSGTTTLTMVDGVFEDGSGPTGDYIGNAGCNWLIAPQDSIENLTLHFLKFNTEQGHDFVTIYDGSDSTARVLGEFSGSDIPPAVTASGNRMYLTFRSDGNTSAPGWLASYKADIADFCQSNSVATAPSGNVSDGSGSYDYHNNTTCKFKITPENATSITLNFQAFNTANENDFLSIYDLNTQKLIRKISGSQNPGTIDCNTGKVIMLFTTDAAGTSAGWQMNYTSDGYVDIMNQDSPESDGINIYPNPSSGFLNIDLSSGIKGKYRLEIISADGTIVYSNPIDADKTPIIKLDISGFQGGLYMLRTVNDQNTLFKKFVIR
jgi:hypothetical protein